MHSVANNAVMPEKAALFYFKLSDFFILGEKSGLAGGRKPLSSTAQLLLVWVVSCAMGQSKPERKPTSVLVA